MSNNKQTHGFCETPHEKCTMSYCDENGCMNRKRNIVGEPIEMSNNKQITMYYKLRIEEVIESPMIDLTQFEVLHNKEN